MDKDTSYRSSGEPGREPPAKNVNVGYEAKDVNAGSVLRLGFLLLLTVVAAQVVVWRALGWLHARQARREPPQSVLLRNVPRQLPPEPRLQGAPGHEIQPPEEMKQLQDAADATLNSYGWVDEKAGVARIPIQQAMKRLATKGLPTAPSGVPAATRGHPREKKP